MYGRRKFIGHALFGLLLFGEMGKVVMTGLSKAWGAAKKTILPPGTKREDLINENPAHLDPRNLETTPLEEFGTMGLSDHMVSLDHWRLKVSGHVKKPARLTYAQVQALPSIEKDGLLICPGFFASYGQWKGISLREILRIAGERPGITHVTVSGPESPYKKEVRFPIKDVREDKVFLAYAVNGKALPLQHGFPLRVVAEDYYGYDWVKYVDNIRVDKIG